MGLNVKNTSVVGIDLGTTFTVAAYIDDTGAPHVIPNLDGSPSTPSVVHVSPNGDVIVGESAANMRFIDPDRTFLLFKTDVGTDKIYADFGNVQVRPDWCQFQVLKCVRESCIKYTGDKLAASKAVITVPTRFGEKERQSVCHSADMAGIQILALINEPTSGGLALGLSQKQGDQLVAIPDFGGGTFDISLVQYSGGKVDVIASCGDTNLGGRDVDNLLLSMVNDRFKEEHGIEISPDSCPEDFYPLLEQVMRNKHLLSSKQEVKLIARGQGKQVVLDISRDQLSRVVQPLMQRIRQITLQVLTDGKVDRSDIDHVVPIGGSSRLKPFEVLMEDLFGKEKVIGGKVSPDLCVAEGAAIKAGQIISKSGAILVDKTLKALPTPMISATDVIATSLGVLIQDKVSDAKTCSVILPKNTTVPCKISKMYGSVEPNQRHFMIAVVQGEEGQSSEDCLEVTEKRVLELPPRSPEKPSIEVLMSYDESGMVNVKVKDEVSGKTEDITIDFYAGK